MPRRCTICQHPQLAEIDEALVRGVPLRDIAGQYGVTRSALQRHAGAHLPAALSRARRAQEAVRADSLLDQVVGLRDHALAVLGRAEKAQDHRSALAAIREARGCVELLARLAGELEERPVVNIQTLYATVEWQQVQALVMEVLEPHLEARRKLVEGLAALEHGGRHDD